MHKKQRIWQALRSIRRAIACLVIVGPILAALPGPATAQLRGCDAVDAQCLDEAYSAPCLAKASPWPETCEALLEELLRYPTLDREPEVLAKAAFARYMLARAAETDAAAAERKQSARELYHRVIALDPRHSDAYAGLAGLADDVSERIRWLRQLRRADDEVNSLSYRALASALDERGTREDRLEAAALVRTAYDAEPWGRHKWYLGAATVSRYTNLGLESEARELRASVREELGIDRLHDEIARTEIDAEASIEALQMICYHSLLAIVGANVCIDAIDLALDAAGKANTPALSQRLAQEALTLMRSIPVTASGRVDRPREIVGSLERLAAAGHESFELYFALARCYIDLNRIDAALAALDEAGARATGYWRDVVEEHIAIARDPSWHASGAGERPLCVPQDTVIVE